MEQSTLDINAPVAPTSFEAQPVRVNPLRRALNGLPKPLRDPVVFTYRLSLDTFDVLLRRRESLVPPRRLSFVGSGDYVKHGDQFLRHFKDLCDLTPDQSVLDVGCGIGRMARPLTKYLTAGSYVGMDIVPRGILWCQRHITRLHPNFTFQLADIYSKEYNPDGRYQAADYGFPFPDGKFDFVFLTSVFTHMLPRDVEQYLREIARCLRPGGKCLITFFLLNETSHELLQTGKSSISFRFPLGDGCWARNARIPEEAVAYEESRIHSLYSQLGLVLQAPEYGSWSGRSQFLSYQDILVAKKLERSEISPTRH
ncbi:MAG: class I SAM-dependent methyltransferase [Candidatus Acidiferrales bacterium]